MLAVTLSDMVDCLYCIISDVELHSSTESVQSFYFWINDIQYYIEYNIHMVKIQENKKNLNIRGEKKPTNIAVP